MSLGENFTCLGKTEQKSAKPLPKTQIYFNLNQINVSVDSNFSS